MSGKKSVEELIAASSLGTPEAVAIRKQASKDAVARVLARSAVRCAARRVDRSYGMDARCELAGCHVGLHSARIGHGHVEKWSGELLDTTPATQGVAEPLLDVAAVEAWQARSTEPTPSEKILLKTLLPQTATAAQYAMALALIRESCRLCQACLADDADAKKTITDQCYEAIRALHRGAKD